jgi:hypothetical protein
LTIWLKSVMSLKDKISESHKRKKTRFRISDKDYISS